MRKKLKTWRGIFKDRDSQAVLFENFVAEDRSHALAVSRHMAPKRFGNPSPKRRRLYRLHGLYKNTWQLFLAFERSLEDICPEKYSWWNRLWQWIMSFWKPNVIPAPAISRPYFRKGPRWEQSRLCPLCGEWSVFENDRANWCNNCSSPVRLHIQNWKLSTTK